MERTTRTRGQSFVLLVLLIGGAIVLVSLVSAFLTASFIDTGYGYQDIVQAQAAAMGGVNDALLQLDRNPAFSSSGYTLSVASTNATVTVTQNSPVNGEATILSSATVSDRTKKVSAVAAFNQSTTQMTVVSMQVVE